MNILKKLQNQPEYIRKIILWATVIIIASLLGIFWLYNSARRIKEFPKEEFMEQLEIPKIEIPEIEIPTNNE